jgi:hypothetical protein
MSRSLQFILVGSVWTLSTVLFAAGLQVPGDTLIGAGWMLATIVFLSCCLALTAAYLQSPLLRSATFICHLLTPLSWTMWVSTIDNAAFSFSTWGLVSLMALVGAVLVEHGLELDFELACSGESALKDALQKAATPILFGPPTLDTGSMRIPT